MRFEPMPVPYKKNVFSAVPIDDETQDLKATSSVCVESNLKYQ